MNSEKTFKELGIFDGANIIIDYKDYKVLMKIYIKVGKKIIPVDVYPQDPLLVLAEKLKVSDKNTKIIWNWLTYTIFSILTFEEAGIKDGSRCYLNNQSIAGISNMIFI